MNRVRWQVALVGITIIWGGTFVVVQDAVEQIPAFRYLAWRFAIAAALMVAVGGLRGLRRHDLAPAMLTGVILFAGYGFQTVGLQYTSASNAGFITGMFVVFTPLFVWILYRRSPAAAALVGVTLAAVGLYLVAAPGRLTLGFGDSLEVCCAASFAAHIVAQHRFADAMPTFRFATLQMLVVACGATLWTGVAEDASVASFETSSWVAIVVTGVFASALAFFVQARAQREVAPTQTAIILTSEPVFAGIFGALDGERIGLRGYAGAGLILTGALVAELRGRASERISEPLDAPT